MATQKKSPTWLKDLLVAFAATTLSIILTFGTTGVINRVKQKQERKLTALMVMSSIEKFARELDFIVEDLAHKDSIATWLLSVPIEEVAELGDFLMDPIRETAGNYIVLARDKSADAIFSSSIETWKNLGCFAFIENVGYTFSEMDDLMPNDFKKPTPDVDSLAVHLSYARQLDSLLRMKHGGSR